MAYWSLYKWFATFRKRPYPCDPIYEYKKYLYQCWYNSLSDEDKQREDERLDHKRKHNEQAFDRALYALNHIASYSNQYGKYWNMLYK